MRPSANLLSLLLLFATSTTTLAVPAPAPGATDPPNNNALAHLLDRAADALPLPDITARAPNPEPTDPQENPATTAPDLTKRDADPTQTDGPANSKRGVGPETGPNTDDHRTEGGKPKRAPEPTEPAGTTDGPGKREPGVSARDAAPAPQATGEQ